MQDLSFLFGLGAHGPHALCSHGAFIVCLMELTYQSNRIPCGLIGYGV